MIKKVILLVLISFIVWFTAGYFSALYLTSRREAPKSKNEITLTKEDIELISKDKVRISAWYIQGTSDKAVIVLAGIGENRASNIARAEFYNKLGYSVLLPDLRATGKSGGDVISFGWNEAQDLIACYDFLKNKKGFRKISAHGCSLGAATIAYSLKNVKDFHFIILESCYDNLNHAFENRVKKFYLPKFLFLPIKFFIKQRIGADPDYLNPAELVKLANCPVLLLAGDSELQIPVHETKSIFKNCGSSKKYLHFFKGGKHEDFLANFKSEYEKIVTGFLKEL